MLWHFPEFGTGQLGMVKHNSCNWPQHSRDKAFMMTMIHKYHLQMIHPSNKFFSFITIRIALCISFFFRNAQHVVHRDTLTQILVSDFITQLDSSCTSLNIVFLIFILWNINKVEIFITLLFRVILKYVLMLNVYVIFILK